MPLDGYQHAAVAACLARPRGLIVGDDMGLGKTLEAIAAVEALDAWPAVFVVPASTRAGWARELHRALPGLRIGQVEGIRPYRSYDVDATVLTPDVLDSHADHLPDTLRAVILDEAHQYRTASSIRARAARRLIARLDNPTVLCLTGTAAVRDTLDLVPLLDMIDGLDLLGGLDAVRRMDPATLNREMRRAGMYIRRRKQLVMPGLPDKHRVIVHVPLSADVAPVYQEAEESLLAFMRRKADRIAELHGDLAGEQVWERAVAGSRMEHLLRIGWLRQLAGRGKVPAGLAWVRARIGSGERLLVFAHHRWVLDRYSAGLKVPKIDGTTTGQARARIVDGFQAGQWPAVVLSVQAAGVGLTLTAAGHVVFAEPSWLPADIEQAEDRAYGRRNDPHGIVSSHLLAAGTIDEMVWDIMAARMPLVSGTIDGHAVEVTGRSAEQEVLARMAALARGRADGRTR